MSATPWAPACAASVRLLPLPHPIRPALPCPLMCCPSRPCPQVFLPPELPLSQDGQALAGLQLLSTSQLIQPRAIEQSGECGSGRGKPAARRGPWQPVAGQRCSCLVRHMGADEVRLSAATGGYPLAQVHLYSPAGRHVNLHSLKSCASPPGSRLRLAVAARCAIARCLARQWFGVLLRAATPLDEWLIEGEPAPASALLVGRRASRLGALDDGTAQQQTAGGTPCTPPPLATPTAACRPVWLDGGAVREAVPWAQRAGLQVRSLAAVCMRSCAA